VRRSGRLNPTKQAHAEDEDNDQSDESVELKKDAKRKQLKRGSSVDGQAKKEKPLLKEKEIDKKKAKK